MWQYRGRERPPIASKPGPGQESVWDYPRPPRLALDTRRVKVSAAGIAVADSRRAIRVLETASPPTFYLPPDDVDLSLLAPATGGSTCEWKGRAAYWSLLLPDGTCLQSVAWSYPHPTPAFAAIAGWLSFYPARLQCEVAGERVRSQPGGFYGGWVTDEIVGPYKGEPGTGHW
jgi:uncharacterized protein (DUF427 family)